MFLSLKLCKLPTWGHVGERIFPVNLLTHLFEFSAGSIPKIFGSGSHESSSVSVPIGFLIEVPNKVGSVAELTLIL